MLVGRKGFLMLRAWIRVARDIPWRIWLVAGGMWLVGCQEGLQCARLESGKRALQGTTGTRDGVEPAWGSLAGGAPPRNRVSRSCAADTTMPWEWLSRHERLYFPIWSNDRTCTAIFVYVVTMPMAAATAHIPKMLTVWILQIARNDRQVHVYALHEHGCR